MCSTPKDDPKYSCLSWFKTYDFFSHSKRGSDHKKRIGANEFTKSEPNYAAMIQLMNAVTLVPTPCVANTQKSLSAFDAEKSEQS
ncbi:hypothetical protein Ddc_18780 [Ditylenchus destructor]|nr:hypothetical protein Ddc_18780 [Ditylenchus destructor]